MGIFARIEKWYEERRLQNKVNAEISANFTDENREALALVNDYGQKLLCYGRGPVNGGRYVRTGFFRKEWRGYYSWEHHPPSKRVPSLERKDKWDLNWVENPDPEYQAMKQFLGKYPEFKTKETEELRGYYKL